jgi:hypothetical protein
MLGWFTPHLPSLAVSTSTLPTPGELTALGIGLLVVAGLVVFFLHEIKLAFYLGAGGVIVLICASVAFGYEAMGEAKIMPQVIALQKLVDDANAEAGRFKALATAAQATAEAALKAKKAAQAKAHSAFVEAVNAQPAIVLTQLVPVPVVELLNSAVDSANASAGLVADAGSKTVAAATSGVTVRDWELWSGTVVQQYADLANQVQGLQAYIQTLSDNAPATVGAPK